MNINAVSNRNFQGKITIPDEIKPQIVQELLRIMKFDSSELSKFSEFIRRIKTPECSGSIQIVPKDGMRVANSISDYDVFVSGRSFNEGGSVSEKFVNAVRQIGQTLKG